MSNILEHLKDPTKLLLNVYPLLADGGKILISVPNVCNMDIIVHLMNGVFNYSVQGILYNTHLKKSRLFLYSIF